MGKEMRTVDSDALKGALDAIEHSAGTPYGQMVGFDMDQVDALKQLIRCNLNGESFYINTKEGD